MIEPDIDTGIIYSVTCRINGKFYIGQARDYKYKNGEPYRYGLKGRWGDHVSSQDTTPFHKAIKKYGEKNFVPHLLLRCKITELDAWEARVVSHNNTLVPNGYNVAKHSRVKNREESNLADFYLEKASKLEIKCINRDQKPRLIYIYISTVGCSERTRLTFGQGKDSSFEKARKEALEFVEPFEMRNIPVLMDPRINGCEDTMLPYYDKIASLKNFDISCITISKHKNSGFDLIVLKIKHSECKNKKDEIKICFGGKTVNPFDAYQISMEFIKRIKNKNTEIIETKVMKKFLKSATGSCE